MPNPLPTDDAYIDEAALASGLDPRFMRRILQIESGGNPKATTGSYRGLFQLSWPEFKAHGGTGDIYDPVQQSKAAATKFKTEADAFNKKYGRDPTPTELYLIHQQGSGGFEAHFNNPTQPAWQSMASTGEGKQKGEKWAKQAIWGNVPDDLKKQYGSVDNITSQDFMNIWKHKVEGTPIVAANTLTPQSQAILRSQQQTQPNQAAQKLLEMFKKPMPDYSYMLPQPKLVPIDYDPFVQTSSKTS